jgi:CO/xanthine dehydrogenase FAD-binding subunit
VLTTVHYSVREMNVFGVRVGDFRKERLMYLLPRFSYYEPRDGDEACRLLSEMKEKAKVLAGGTDVLVNMKRGSLKTPNVVSILRIREIRGVESKIDCICLGAALLVVEISESAMLHQHFPALVKAARLVGSPLIQNRATIGGNIVRASPAADLPPPLMAYGARLVLKSVGGNREVSLDDFFVGPEKTVIEPTEILTSIIVDKPPAHTGADYVKLGHRNAMECAITAVASRITLDKPDGVIKDAGVILSAVAPKSIHARKAEEILIGEKPSEELFAKAATMASKECSPIDDIRSGAEYRRCMAGVLTKRTLLSAWHEARGGDK